MVPGHTDLCWKYGRQPDLGTSDRVTWYENYRCREAVLCFTIPGYSIKAWDACSWAVMCRDDPSVGLQLAS